MNNMKKEKTYTDRVYFTWSEEQKEKFERRMIEYALKSNKVSSREMRPGRFFYKLMNLIIEYNDFADFIFFYDPNKKNLKKEQK